MKSFFMKNYKKIGLLFLFFIYIGTPVMAKYFHEEEQNSLYEAENFYFRSDVLKEEVITYTYPSGVHEISFNLSNNEDDLRYTKTNISYTVSLSQVKEEGTLLKASETLETQKGTLEGTSLQAKKITFDNLAAGTYKVVATALSPYEKTLEAYFIIKDEEDEISYEVSSNEESYILFLTISTKDYEGDFTLTLPDNLYPDNTDPLFKDMDINKSKTITLFSKNHASVTYRFYKEKATDIFSKESFIIKKV